MSPAIPASLVGSSTLPSLSQIQGWDTTHLDDAASQWHALADESERIFQQHRQNMRAPGGTVWTGSAADTAGDRATADAGIARRQSEVMRQAVTVAINGAGDLRAAQRLALEAVSDAGGDGFRVNEDLSVTDTRRIDLNALAARTTAASEHAEYIRWRAQQLVECDARIAKDLQEQADELDGIQFEPSRDGSIQLVDNDKPAAPPLLPGPPPSPSRREAVEYAEKWANGFNPEYEKLGGGGEDCTNFVSQVMRAGGFGDVGNGIDDWRRGDSNDWYNQDGSLVSPLNRSSKTWTLAKENHNFVTQHSDRGEIVGVVDTPTRAGLDPLAPSRAGLVPGDLIYYKDERGEINHVAVYVGQTMQDGVLTDVINQHSGTDNVHNDWMPGPGGEYVAPFAQAEFVHLRYPGE